MAWTEWKRMFDTYMDPIDSDLFSDKRKTALLLHSLGAEGQRRYSKLKELANYPDGATEFEKTNLKLANEYKVVRNKRAELTRLEDGHNHSVNRSLTTLPHYAISPLRATSSISWMMQFAIK